MSLPKKIKGLEHFSDPVWGETYMPMVKNPVPLPKRMRTPMKSKKIEPKIVKLPDDPIKGLEQLGNYLQKLIDNPDGGELTVKAPGQPDIVFFMPKLKDRKPLFEDKHHDGENV